MTSINDTSIEDDEEGFFASGTLKHNFKCFISEEVVKSCSCLIFTDGIQAAAFAENCLKLSTPVGKIENQVEKDEMDIDLSGLCHNKIQPSHFYQLNKEVVVCLVNSALNTEDYYPLVSSVVKSFSSKVSILVLTSSASAHFKSDVHSSELETPIFRTLCSTSFPSSCLKLHVLEQPNVLAGLSAAVLSICDIRGYSAAACIVYSSSLDLEAGTIKGFFDFLQSLQQTRSIQINKSGKTYSISADASFKTGNLYI